MSLTAKEVTTLLKVGTIRFLPGTWLTFLGTHVHDGHLLLNHHQRQDIPFLPLSQVFPNTGFQTNELGYWSFVYHMVHRRSAFRHLPMPSFYSRF